MMFVAAATPVLDDRDITSLASGSAYSMFGSAAAHVMDPQRSSPPQPHCKSAHCPNPACL
jgi:hypothetical protein